VKTTKKTPNAFVAAYRMRDKNNTMPQIFYSSWEKVLCCRIENVECRMFFHLFALGETVYTTLECYSTIVSAETGNRNVISSKSLKSDIRISAKNIQH
jgi:hypothetical protein